MTAGKNWDALRGLNVDAMREGQRLAVRVAVDRYLEGKSTTSIVLPTRYGKTDTMRIITLVLWRDGFLPVALLLSPNVVLRDQSADPKRWTEALRRYAFDVPTVAVRTLANPEVDPASNGEVFLSATTQLVERNIDLFRMWVESVLHRTGRRVIVFIDECHTGSEDNSWGNVSVELEKAGAHIVLLTATAIRADGKRIPGFKWESTDEKPVVVVKTRPAEDPELIHVELYAGVKRWITLLADHCTEFKDAWAENALCKISRLPFDVDLSLVQGGRDGDDAPAGLRKWLSELEPTQARSALSRCVRSRIVMQEGVHRLVAQLRIYKAGQPDNAAIVFCGNDDDKEDPAINKHAQQIRAEILRLMPDLKIIIATSADSGKDRLEAFAGGVGDVLIVKQMASIGLDVPRLKVALDLSPIRTVAQYIQRMMRIGTPYRGTMTATWICPDDILGRAIWDKIVTTGNGEATATDLELIREYDAPRGEEKDSTYYGIDGAQIADFEDTNQLKAKKELWLSVEALCEAFPQLAHFYSLPEIASRAETFGITPSEKLKEDGPAVVDTAVQTEVMRGNVNELTDEIAKSLSGGVYDPNEWGELKRDIYLRAYRDAGVSPGTELRKIGDIKLLERILVALKRQLKDANRYMGKW